MLEAKILWHFSGHHVSRTLRLRSTCTYGTSGVDTPVSHLNTHCFEKHATPITAVVLTCYLIIALYAMTVLLWWG